MRFAGRRRDRPAREPRTSSACLLNRTQVAGIPRSQAEEDANKIRLMPLDPGPQDPGIPVTPRNWQDPPVNRWAYWHVRDILPTYRVSRGDGAVRALPAAAAAANLLGIEITRADGSAGTVGEVLADTYTDAYVVLQDGQLVTEWYGPLGGPEQAHALMSVSKSVVGCVAAVLIDRGLLDAERPVADYVPELAASGYAGATVRNVLDMRSGVRFLEEYANPQADKIGRAHV